jgi:hypothetical protein
MLATYRGHCKVPQAIKPWYKETRFLIAVAVIVIIIVLAAIPPSN